MSTSHRADLPQDPDHTLPVDHGSLPHAGGPLGRKATDDDLARVQASDEFQELKRRFRSFAFPLSIAFLVWYFAFVLLSTYAVDFMSRPVLGRVTIGLVMGLLQFVTTFGITALYIRHANKNLDPIANKIKADLEALR